MRTLARLSPWLARLVLLMATLLFAMIALKYITDPVTAAQRSGMSLNSPVALTNMRAGFGAFPLACAAVTLICLISVRRLRIGLTFIALLIGIVLIVRLYGIEEDGTLTENLRVLTAEAVLFSVTLIALLIGAAAARFAAHNDEQTDHSPNRRSAHATRSSTNRDR